MKRRFKQADIKPCAICGKGIMHAGMPLFFRVRIERLGLNRAAIQRQHGLEMMMNGNSVLAHVMGADEDMAEVIDSVEDALVCHPCAIEPHPLFLTMENKL